MNKLALTPKEAAALTPLGENRIRELCLSDPTFPSFKNGRDTVIPTKAFTEWLDNQAKYRTGYPMYLRVLPK